MCVTEGGCLQGRAFVLWFMRLKTANYPFLTPLLSLFSLSFDRCNSARHIWIKVDEQLRLFGEKKNPH